MRKGNVYNIALILLTGALLFGFGIAILIGKKPEYSETENKRLSNVLKPTAENLANGSFFESVSDFYKDRFPAKSEFLALRAASELALLKGENNRVIFGEDGYLIPRGEYVELDTAKENLAFLRELQNEAEGRGKDFLLLPVPRSIDIMESALPRLYRGEQNKIWSLIESAEIDCLFVSDSLRELADKGGYVQYRTDHHLTTAGAYAVYGEIGRSLGFSPCPEGFFRVETVSDSFYGTSYSKAGEIWGRADSVELYRYAGDGDFIIEVSESGQRLSGFYDESYLDKKDKYSVFLGGNYGMLTVKRGGEERESLLIIKDSYANAMIPFLAIHYDLMVIDPRYFVEDIYALMDEADGVLAVIGADTLATTPLAP